MRAIQSVATVHSILGTCIAALALSACGGSQPPAPAAPPPAPTMSAAAAPAPAPVVSAAPVTSATTAAAPAPEHKFDHRFHHPAIGMLMVEVAQVGLRPEQQTAVDAIKADLDKQADASKAQRTQLTSDIADGVAAGKLDKAKIDADVKKLQQAADSTTKSVQDSVNKLHQTLDATQRKKLVDSMQAKAEEMREHGAGEMHEPGHGEHGMGPKGPGGEPGKGAQGEPGKAPHGEHGMGPKGPGEHGMPHGMGPHGEMEKLGQALGLTPDQQEKLKTKLDALMKSHMATMQEHQGAMQKRMKAVGEAFASDKFDAKKVGVGEKFGEMIKMMTKGRIEFVEAVLSVLTPEQRSKFAEHIRQHSDTGED